MRVQDVMTTNVHTVTPTTDAAVAWDLMRAKGVHHLVVARGASVVGLLSDRDAGSRRGAALRAGRLVSDLMTDRVVAVEPTTTVRKAANLMRGRSIGSLVVTSRGRIVGIVTVADLLELIGRGVERPVAATTRWTLKHRMPHHKQPSARGMW
ncbi:MAG: CBS domain-containing protein [Vicinamibacterales bacterium]